MKQLYLPIFLFISLNLSAQLEPELDPNSNFSGRTPAMDFLFQELRSKNIRSTNTDEIIGSPYLNEAFIKSKVFYGDKFIGDYFVRYNAFNSEMEIKETQLEEEKPKRLLADKKTSIIYDDRALRFTTYIDKKGKTKNGYLTQLVSDGPYKLYHRLSVKYSEGKAAANSMVNPVPSRFAHFEEYFYKKEDVDRIDQLPQNKNKFLKIFDKSKKEDIKAFLKENDIDLNSEENLIKAFKYVNALQQN